MDSCDRIDCRNRGERCLRCENYKLYHPKSRKCLRARNSKKQGMSFQRKVKEQYEEKLGKKAYETPNSGALWFLPGDESMEEFLAECKERKISARGEKQFTITKEMLEKIDREAGGSKPGVVVFGFKGDDKTYVVADFNVWLELIQELDRLKNKEA